MTREQRSYQTWFIVALTVSWLPAKFLPYLLPPVMLLGFLCGSGRGLVSVQRLLVLLLTTTGVTALLGLVQEDFVVGHAFLWMMTFSGLGLWFVLRGGRLRSDVLWANIVRLVAVTVAIEGAIGIVQGVYGAFQAGTFDLATGDHVEGTIHLPLSPERSFANAMFAVNISLGLIVVLSHVHRKKYKATFVIGIVALVLASVVHVLIFTAVSLVVALLLMGAPHWESAFGRVRRGAVGVAAAIVVLSGILLSQNLEQIPAVADPQRQDPRAVLIRHVIDRMPQSFPSMPLVGLGPGQFVSRAGLMATGLYFGGPSNPRDLWVLKGHIAPAQEEFLIEVWQDADATYALGSSRRPFFSWLALYTEFGLLGLSAVIWFAFRKLWRIRSAATSRGTDATIMGVALASGVIFVLLLGLQENYWEVPQAFLPGLLSLKVIDGAMMCAEP